MVKVKEKKVPSAATGKHKGKVPENAVSLFQVGSTDHMYPVFSFKYVDPNKWLLSDWQGNELIELIECFKTMENLTWSQIQTHSGLRYKAIEGTPKIKHFDISPDETIHELRVCKVKRIHGFRERNVFYIIWFDRNHSVCPEGKNRTYG